jgi:hypothetical protein
MASGRSQALAISRGTAVADVRPRSCSLWDRTTIRSSFQFQWLRRVPRRILRDSRGLEGEIGPLPPSTKLVATGFRSMILWRRKHGDGEGIRKFFRAKLDPFSAVEGTFAERQSATHSAGDAVIPAGYGRIDEVRASHCHAVESPVVSTQFTQIVWSSQYCIACPRPILCTNELLHQRGRSRASPLSPDPEVGYGPGSAPRRNADRERVGERPDRRRPGGLVSECRRRRRAGTMAHR